MILFKKDIEEGVDTLNKGGLILFPTDGSWAIGCDATNESAIERIYKMIGKKDTNKMVLLLQDEQDILRYTAQEGIQIMDYIQGLSAPFSTIYQKGKGVAENMLSKRRNIAIRLTKNLFCKSLISYFKKPLVCTEATLYKHKVPSHFSEINPEIVRGVDFVFDIKQNTLFSSPSPIIRWEKDGSLSILRP